MPLIQITVFELHILFPFDIGVMDAGIRPLAKESSGWESTELASRVFGFERKQLPIAIVIGPHSVIFCIFMPFFLSSIVDHHANA
jgi:hypothetical protein